MPFASSSVGVHLARGIIGVLAAVAAFAGVALVGSASLLLLVVTVLAWRGCPTCWAVGLMQTVEDQRCRNGACRR